MYMYLSSPLVRTVMFIHRFPSSMSFLGNHHVRVSVFGSPCHKDHGILGSLCGPPDVLETPISTLISFAQYNAGTLSKP